MAVVEKPPRQGLGELGDLRSIHVVKKKRNTSAEVMDVMVLLEKTLKSWESDKLQMEFYNWWKSVAFYSYNILQTQPFAQGFFNLYIPVLNHRFPVVKGVNLQPSF